MPYKHVMCFSCACAHPLVQHLRGSNSKYDAARASSRADFLMWLATKRIFFRKHTYIAKYGRRVLDGSETNMNSPEWAREFQDWEACVRVRGRRVNVLCCPEDIHCENHVGDPCKWCSHCRVPLCSDCASDIFNTDGPRQPTLALTNDLYIGFSSPLVYEMKVTYLEMLAASPCCLGLACMALQAARGVDSSGSRATSASRNALSEPAFMQMYRTAVRGNITLCMMPLADVLCELQAIENVGAADVPRSAVNS